MAQRIGIKAPKTFSVVDYPSLAEALKEVGYPAMVKGLFYKA